MDSLRSQHNSHPENNAYHFAFIFIFALIIKSLAFIWYEKYLGGGFYLTHNSSQAILFRQFLLSPNPVPVQAYDDIWYHYTAYVDAFAHGWNPYSDTGLSNDAITGNYNYGPLYLVLISWGTVIFNLSPFDSVMVSNHLFDALNCGILYLILRYFMSGKRAGVITLVYIISPVMLFYVDFKLLNLPQMTFFSLLCIWAFLNNRHQLVWIALACGFSTKFIPIFLAFPLFLYYLKKTENKQVIQYIVLFLSYNFVFLFPFILDDPQGVFDQFALALTRDQASDIALASFIVPNLPLFFGSLVTYSFFRYGGKNLVEDKILVLRILMFYIIWAHGSFYPLWSRGLKYYHGYLFVFYLILIFVQHDLTPRKFSIGLLLSYFLNALIFALPINITAFHHRRVFWIYLPVIVIIWLYYDLYKLKQSITEFPPIIENNHIT